jgi:hypothetical protein
MEPATKVNGTELKSEGHLDKGAAIQSPKSPIAAASAPRPGGVHENPPIETGGTASNQNAADVWPREQPLSQKAKAANKERRQERTWLMDEPQGWVGRRVRCRRNMGVYTISQVYKNGRVSLERNWMSYFTDVETVRKDYDTYC